MREHGMTPRRAIVIIMANIEATMAGGWNAVHLACKGGCEATLAMLLECGARADVATKNGWTALHLAAANGNGGAFKALLFGLSGAR